jgi:hypothetical protein
MQRVRTFCSVAALMLTTVSAWAQGTTFKDVIALDFSKPEDQAKIQINGMAQWAGRAATTAPPTAPLLRLTEDGNQSGSAFLPAGMGLSDYQVQFDFQVQKVSAGDTQAADGFTFTAQSVGAASLGGGGGNLGFSGAGISQAGYCYAIEFNLYPPQGLSDAPETVALDLGIPGSRVGDFRIRLNQTPLPFLGNGVFHAVIRVTPDKIAATFSGGNLPADKPINWSTPSFIGGGLFKPLDTSNQPLPLFLGFTGATGGARAVIDILNFRVQVPA